MNIIDFLNKYEIDWFPINLTLTNDHNTVYSNGEIKKKKNLIPIEHELYKRTTNEGHISYKPSPDDFLKLPPHTIKARQELHISKEIKFNSIWIDTSERYKHIDIDTPEYSDGFKYLLDTMPYYKSMTKSFGRHIFIECPDFAPSKKKYIFNNNENIELLSGQPAYCDIYGVVENASSEGFVCEGIQCNNSCDIKTCKSYSMGLKGIKDMLKIDKKDILTTFKHKNLSDGDKSELFNKLSKLFSLDLDTVWNISEVSNGYKLLPKNNICLVNGETHKQHGHSCCLISKRGATAYCFSHGSKKLNDNELNNIRKTLGLIKDDKKQLSEPFKVSQKIEIQEDIVIHILNNLSTSHEQVASLFKLLYKNEFICASERGQREWYSYTDGLWHEVGESSISKLISEDFVNILKNYSIYFRSKLNDLEWRNEYQIDPSIKILVIDDVIMKCETTGYISSLTKQLIQKYIVPKFVEKLDMNINLLCFGKDTYDLKNNEWRDTRRDDYFSKKCGVSKEEVNPENVNEMMEIINSIFTDEESRDYFLFTLSDMLLGKNEKEVFHIWSGSGGNGKGLLASFIEEALGDYFVSGNIALLTNKKEENPNGCSPEMIKLHGVRIAMFSEPPLYAKLNNATMNKWTGGRDKLQGRALFKETVNFIPQFTPIIQCNTTFKLQNVEDDSIPRRLILTNFKYSFVDQPKFSHQRKRNNKIKGEETLNKLKGAMMYIMLDTYKYLSPNHTFSVPLSIKNDKEEFLGENDSLSRFIEEKIEITENEKDFIRVKEILSEYREYLSTNRETNCKDTLKRFQNKLNKYLPEYKERVNHYENGILERVRSVYIKCKFKID